MTSIGVIAPSGRTETAFGAGVDYVEPSIVGNVAVADGDGWRLAPEYEGRRHPSFAILFPGDVRVADPGFPRERVSAYVDAVLPLVASVAEPGAKIVFGSGRSRTVPDGADRAAAEERFADVLRETRDRAAGLGLQIMLEPLHQGETNLVNSIREAVAFLDGHGVTGVPVVADLFHIELEREPFTVLHDHADRIGHAHIADAGRRYLGSGDWPWREFVRELHTVGYDGSISLECIWGEDFGAEVRASVERLRAL
ncbi:sugar phosphate isomerase/epimerase family protein [Pseudonocardia sichuanensis]